MSQFYVYSVFLFSSLLSISYLFWFHFKTLSARHREWLTSVLYQFCFYLCGFLDLLPVHPKNKRMVRFQWQHLRYVFFCLYCICSYLHAAFVFVPIAVGFVGDMYTQKLLQALPPLLKLHWSSNFVFQCICICFKFAFDFSSNLNFVILWKPVLGRHTQEGFWAFTFRLEFYF